MNDTSTRPDSMAGKIEEEFGKWWDSIDSDDKWETDRDGYKQAFAAGFHAASKESERLKKQRDEWEKCYTSRTKEVVELRGRCYELREALDYANSWMRGRFSNDL